MLQIAKGRGNDRPRGRIPVFVGLRVVVVINREECVRVCVEVIILWEGHTNTVK